MANEDTIEVEQLLVGGDHRGYFSTFAKAHAWKIAYADEFPAVNRIGWEIKKGVRVAKDTELDLPMNWKRGRD